MSALDNFLSSGPPIAKFNDIGDVIKGVITAVDETQQQDFKTRKPLFWDDGNPRMQYIITLATDERDPTVTNDDGARRLFAKSGLQKAIVAAIRDSGATKDQIVGGTLAVQWTENGEPPAAGLNAPKIYRAEFKPGTASAGALLDSANPTPAAAPTAEQPAGPVQASSLI